MEIEPVGDRKTISILRGIHYLVTACHFWYVIFFDAVYVFPAKGNPAYGLVTGFGGKFRFYTSLCTICQASYYTLCLLNEFFGSTESHPRQASTLRKIKDFFFAAFAFPMAMYTGTSFWTIYAFDRNMIFPATNDEFFPSWLNHMVHTNIMIFIMFELFSTFRVYPARKKAATSLAIFNSAYVVWICTVKYVSGTWAYPVLDRLNSHQQIGFILLGVVSSTNFYFIGEFCNNLIWANELKASKSDANKD